MLFDDRLATVLRLRGDSPAIARIQYRQLVDLLGSMPARIEHVPSPTLEAAHARLVELGTVIPAETRAAILRDPALRLTDPALVALLAQGEPAVAEAAIRLARLDETQWLDLAPALPLHARGAMRARRDLGPMVEARMAQLGIGERALPAAEVPVSQPAPRPEKAAPKAPAPVAAPVADPLADHAPAAAPTGIGDLVRRIEAYRKARPQAAPLAASPEAPRLPLGDSHAEDSASATVIDLLTDTAGRVSWAEAPFTPLLAGLALLGAEPGGPVEAAADLRLAFRRRQPVRGQGLTITGAPAIAGDWQLDASPRFATPGGQFTGYAGRLRRPLREVPAEAPPSEGERIRQVLHELRTPVNAIQGFAEVIQQQLFGPTPHEYRAHAAAIAADAARILAAFEELERLARLDTGVLALEAGRADLAAIVGQTVSRLEAFTSARGSGFRLSSEPIALPVAIEPAEAERLVWRLLAALAASAAPGEVLAIKLRERHGEARMTVDLPRTLAASTGDDLFRAAAPQGGQALSAGAFGTGFALRLGRAEARSAGGRLKRRDDRLRLSLPLAGLTEADLQPSHKVQDGG